VDADLCVLLRMALDAFRAQRQEALVGTAEVRDAAVGVVGAWGFEQVAGRLAELAGVVGRTVLRRDVFVQVCAGGVVTQGAERKHAGL
jgi:hypothetical protein